jgi:GT2 family glycosyltransferase
MKIFVIILNWNNKGLTLACLQSLRKINYPPQSQVSFLVVDNGSTDGSIKAIKRLNKSINKKIKIELLENKENLGYAEGNNRGMEYALERGADYLLILNNDLYFKEDFLIQLIEVAEKERKAGLLSPKIYFAPGYEFHKGRYQEKEKGKVIWYAGGTIDWDNILTPHRGVDEVDKGQYDQVCETDFASGSCLLIKREVVEKIGFFDKKLFMYWEDSDLSQRARRAGWRVLYVPKAKVWHKVAASSAIGSPLNDYYLTRNRLLFGLRYARMRTKFALFRESIRILLKGRKWQRIGVRDFYLMRFGQGSYSSKKDG